MDNAGKPPKQNCLHCVQRAVSGSADLGIRVCLSSGPEGKTTVCVCQLAHREHEKNTEFRAAAFYWIVDKCV